MTRAVSLLAVAALATAAFAWQATVVQLQQDGKTVSTNLRVVDGTLMVPVKDVAAYLGGDLKVENGTATIVSSSRPQPGGAPYQAGAALPGFAYSGAAAPFGQGSLLPSFPPNAPPVPKEIVVKTGQDAVAGDFALRLVSVEDVAKGDYRTEFDGRRRKIASRNRDERLVVARLRMENVGETTRRAPALSGDAVTLFDERGVGTPALAFDARSVDTYDQPLSDDLPAYIALEAPLLTPKGAFEFAAVFSLPKGRALKRLAVSLPGTGAGDAGASVMVSLEP